LRKLAILTFQTLDGVMQAPSAPEEDLSGGFSHGGWAGECWQEVMTQVTREAMAEPLELLLGGNTYDIFAPHFSTAKPGDLTAQKLNASKKYVVTSRLNKLTWKNSVKIKGDIVAEISALKEEVGPLLQVHGSWQLIQVLLEHGLIDEYRLWTFPVVVGNGKRLFSDGAIPAKHKLIKFGTCPSGAFMHFYQNIKQG
jgi:dihydrofolate reductase